MIKKSELIQGSPAHHLFRGMCQPACVDRACARDKLIYSNYRRLSSYIIVLVANLLHKHTGTDTHPHTNVRTKHIGGREVANTSSTEEG